MFRIILKINSFNINFQSSFDSILWSFTAAYHMNFLFQLVFSSFCLWFLLFIVSTLYISLKSFYPSSFYTIIYFHEEIYLFLFELFLINHLISWLPFHSPQIFSYIDFICLKYIASKLEFAFIVICFFSAFRFFYSCFQLKIIIVQSFIYFILISYSFSKIHFKA